MKKEKLILPIAIFFAVFSVFLVSATTTVSSPVYGGNYSGTLTFTVSTTINSTKDDANVSLYCNTTGGEATEAMTRLTTISNTSMEQNAYTGPVTLSSYADLTTYNCSAVADNTTDKEFSTATLIITIDNTACAGTATIQQSEVDFGRSFTYNTSLTDATSGVASSSCQIADPSGKYIGSITTADTNLVFPESTRNDGVWNITCNGTDYASNTCTFSDTVKVLTLGAPPASTEEGGNLIDKLKSMDKKYWLIIGGIALALIYFGKKK